MSKRLEVLICGTGFAGQGHTQAFRDASAEVVGIVGRTESVAREVAEKLGIPYVGLDWEKALHDCQPNIVSIGTPGGAHVEPIKQAIEFGCHVFCDKPLTESGDSARELYELAVAKSAYDRQQREKLGTMVIIMGTGMFLMTLIPNPGWGHLLFEVCSLSILLIGVGLKKSARA